MLGLSVVEVWLKPKNAGVTKRNIINVFSNVAVKFGMYHNGFHLSKRLGACLLHMCIHFRR